MSDIYNNPGGLMQALENLGHGLAKFPPAGQSQLTVSGKVSSLADLSTEILGYVSLFQAAEEAEQARVKALLAREAIEPTATSRFEEIRAALKGALGKKNPDLHHYGLAPAQTPASLTVEQKSAKVAKAKATRAARHTLGSKQKKAIKGQWPPVAAPLPATADKPSA